MKKSVISKCMRSLMMAAGLMVAGSAMADNVIGQKVTEFTDAETMKYDWPYTIQGASKQLVRCKLLTFKIDAPAAGQYAVEYLVNATGNNVQLGATASQEEYIYDMPAYAAFTHMTTLTDEDLPIPAEPSTDEPAEGEPVVEPFVPAEPVYMYSSVDLQQGVNYVHVFMHIYWRQDNLAPQKVQFKSIRLLPEGSGKVADVAARASQKAFRVKYFRSLQDETTASVVSNYEALLRNILTDYATADTMAVTADMAAAEAKEQDVRHGKGAMVTADSTRIDLLLYHSEYDKNGKQLGGYAESGAYELEFGREDYPAQMEYTRTLSFTYKFTTGDIPADGKWYIQYLASSKNTAYIDMTVLADDSTTVVMPTYRLSTNNGDWQKYQPMDNRNMAKFSLEPNKTYFLHMYYDDYSNVRDILVRYMAKEYHTAEQLEDMLEQAQDVLAQYSEGTDGFFAVEDRTLLDNLDEAMAAGYEAMGSGDEAAIDQAWELVNEAILALRDLKKLNVLPSTIVSEDTGESSFDVRAIVESNNCSYKTADNLVQLDNFKSGGYMLYKIYNKQDADYQLDFEFAHANAGAKVEVQVYVADDSDPSIHFVTADGRSEEFEGTGGWQAFVQKTMTVGAIPEGYVYLKITGTGPSYVGNVRKFVFTPIAGTEGNGAKALQKAKDDYYAQFSVESVNALITQARDLLAPYAAGSEKERLLVDRTPIDVLEAAIAQGEAAVASQEGEALKDAFYALEEAIKGMEGVKIMNTLPSADVFDLMSYTEARNVKAVKSNGVSQLDSFKSGGSIVYQIYNTKDCEYEVTLDFGHAKTGGQLAFEVYVMEDTVKYVCATSETEPFAGTGNWTTWETKAGNKVGAMPEGYVWLRISGLGNELTDGSREGYAGNMQNFVFTPIAGTEGNGATALQKAKDDWATGIGTAKTATMGSHRIYTLSGQYVGNSMGALQKGIYVVNGKKYVKR